MSEQKQNESIEDYTKRLLEDLQKKDKELKEFREEMENLKLRLERESEENKRISKAKSSKEDQETDHSMQRFTTKKNLAEIQTSSDEEIDTRRLESRVTINKPNDTNHQSRLHVSQSRSNTDSRLSAESDNYNKPKPSVKCLTKFTGRQDEIIEDWIFEMDLYFSQTNYNEEDKVKFAVGWLKDNARSTYINFQHTIETWNDLKNALKRR